MKCITALLVIFLMLLALAGCGTPAQEPETPSEASSESSSGTPSSSAPEPNPYDADPAAWLAENYPATDGSTSLIPLEAGVRAALFGVSRQEAEPEVTHSSTYGAYTALVEGRADLIFTVPFSAQQVEDAANQGVTFEQTPVAKEGFVFVVNAENPVDTLTQEQLRGIYSGAITNWREVGGDDEEIVAYQRNTDSGSQNYMLDFMGDTPLTDAPSERQPGSMGGLMDAIAVNDHGAASIGYSVYTYAADMYEGGGCVKFIAVDGVAPTKATMLSGEYPLVSLNYAVYRADEPEDAPARRLAAWIASPEGQRAVAEAGYVTVEDIGFDYDAVPPLYDGVGTGVAWDGTTPTGVYVATNPGGNPWLPVKVTKPEVINKREGDGILPFTTGTAYRLECLANKTLQDEINAWLAEAVARADERAPAFERYLRALNAKTSAEWQSYWQATDWHNGIQQYYPSAIVSATAVNGYLSVTVGMAYFNGAEDYQDYRYYSVEAIVCDLIEGRRLTTEERFCEGVDIGEAVNPLVARKALEPTSLSMADSCPKLITENTALPADGWVMTADTLYYSLGNATFAQGYAFPLDLADGVLASDAERDMTDCFTDSVTVRHTFRKSRENVVREYVNDDLFVASFLDESLDDTGVYARINADFRAYLANFTGDNARAWFDANGMKNYEVEAFMYGWGCTVYSGRFVLFASQGAISASKSSNGMGTVEMWEESVGQTRLYDLATGRLLDWRALVAENWRDLARATASDANYDPVDVDLATLDPDGYTLRDLSMNGVGTYAFQLYFKAPDGGELTLELPAEGMAWQRVSC